MKFLTTDIVSLDAYNTMNNNMYPGAHHGHQQHPAIQILRRNVSINLEQIIEFEADYRINPCLTMVKLAGNQFSETINITYDAFVRIIKTGNTEISRILYEAKEG